VRREALNEEDESLVYLLRVNEVVIVQDKDHIERERGDVVQQRGQQAVEGRRLGRLQRREDAGAEAGDNRLQGGDEIGEKARGVAVRFLQRQPGDAQLWLAVVESGHPGSNEHGLAGTGGRRDEGEFAGEALVLAQVLTQPFQQVGTGNGSGPRRGDIQFGGEDRCGHGSIIQLLRRRAEEQKGSPLGRQARDELLAPQRAERAGIEHGSHRLGQSSLGRIYADSEGMGTLDTVHAEAWGGRQGGRVLRERAGAPRRAARRRRRHPHQRPRRRHRRGGRPELAVDRRSPMQPRPDGSRSPGAPLGFHHRRRTLGRLGRLAGSPSR